MLEVASLSQGVLSKNLSNLTFIHQLYVIIPIPYSAVIFFFQSSDLFLVIVHIEIKKIQYIIYLITCIYCLFWGFPGGAVVKNHSVSAGDPGDMA